MAPFPSPSPSTPSHPRNLLALPAKEIQSCAPHPSTAATVISAWTAASTLRFSRPAARSASSECRSGYSTHFSQPLPSPDFLFMLRPKFLQRPTEATEFCIASPCPLLSPSFTMLQPHLLSLTGHTPTRGFAFAVPSARTTLRPDLTSHLLTTTRLGSETPPEGHCCVATRTTPVTSLAVSEREQCTQQVGHSV